MTLLAERGTEKALVALAVGRAMIRREVRSRIVAEPVEEQARIERAEELHAFILTTTGHHIPQHAICADHDAPQYSVTKVTTLQQAPQKKLVLLGDPR